MLYRTIALLMALVFGALLLPVESVAAEKRVTQGDYAVALLKKIVNEGDYKEGPLAGLKDIEISAPLAIRKLEELGIEPEGGWKQTAKMTPEAIVDIYRDLVEGIDAHLIDLTVDHLREIIHDLSVALNLPLPATLPKPSGTPAPTPTSAGVTGSGGGESVSE